MSCDIDADTMMRVRIKYILWSVMNPSLKTNLISSLSLLLNMLLLVSSNQNLNCRYDQ